MKTLADNWIVVIQVAGWLCLAIALAIQLIYYYELTQLQSRTEKYKFASAEESHRLRWASYFFSMGLGFMFFQLVSSWVGVVLPFQFFFIGFFALIIAYAVGFTCWAILKYYYPFLLEKRLNLIRFKPMYSKNTGHELRLLTEDQEDAHMTEEMLEEENAFSADYDVWFNDETGEKIIEKYDTHFHRLLCEECNFRTMKEVKENIVKPPTNTEEGLMEKEYKCSYCGHKETKQRSIPSWLEESTYA